MRASKTSRPIGLISVMSMIALFLIGGATQSGGATATTYQHVAPFSAATTSGNVGSGIPFSCATFPQASIRFQQVYSGPEIGAGVISRVAFRPDELGAAAFGPTTFAGATVTLSSTTKAVDGLSATFADNVGSDVITVYSGDLTLSSADTGGPPRAFDITIPLQNTFTFRETTKNLLLDVTLPSCETTTRFDAVDNATDSVSQLTSDSASAATGGLHTAGLVTRFTTSAVVVPSSAATSAANSSFHYPFNCAATGGEDSSLRYQQVYRGSDVGTGTITALAFRPEETSGFGGSFGPTTIPDVAITLSSTTRSVGGLSTTFADNVGSDVTTVFSGDLILRSGKAGGSPPNFDISVPLQTGFSFGDAATNLLFDVKIPDCGSTTAFDASFLFDDGVSQVNAFDVNATTGTAGTDGLVTAFVFDPAAPAITSASSATFVEGTAGSFTVTATGIPTPSIGASGTIPSGVSFLDNGNGTATLSGSPGSGAAGSYPLSITASNGVAPNATQNFTLTVSPASTAPAITSANTTAFTIGSAETFSVTASGTPTPAISSAGTLPSGVTLGDNGDGTATLSGTPASGTAGSYPLTITASNTVGTANQSFTLTVLKAASATSAITSSVNPSIVGQSVTFTATVTAVAPATGTPTGTVDFFDGATNIGPRTLNGSGVAMFSTTALTVGTHSITAVYGGDGKFDGSNDAASPLTQQVTHGIKLLYDGKGKMPPGTLPIKVSLVDFAGRNQSSPSLALTVTGVAPDPGVAQPSGAFTFMPTLNKTGGYQFNLKTNGYARGSYNLLFTVTNDPVTHRAPFTIR